MSTGSGAIASGLHPAVASLPSSGGGVASNTGAVSAPIPVSAAPASTPDVTLLDVLHPSSAAAQTRQLLKRRTTRFYTAGGTGLGRGAGPS